MTAKIERPSATLREGGCFALLPSRALMRKDAVIHGCLALATATAFGGAATWRLLCGDDENGYGLLVLAGLAVCGVALNVVSYLKAAREDWRARGPALLLSEGELELRLRFYRKRFGLDQLRGFAVDGHWLLIYYVKAPASNSGFVHKARFDLECFDRTQVKEFVELATMAIEQPRSGRE